MKKLLIMVLLTSLSACGGGGTGNPTTPPVTPPVTPSPPVTVTGTAATGQPLATAAITLVDADGKTVQGTTGTDGRFSLSAPDLTAPFLLRAELAGGQYLYGASAEAGTAITANATPLTDFIVRAWYRSQDLDVAVAFDDPAIARPSAIAMALSSRQLLRQMEAWLPALGLDSWTWHPFSTPFIADGQGIDGLYDRMRVDAATGQLSLSVADMQQQMQVQPGSLPGLLVVRSETSGVQGSTSRQQVMLLPGPAQQAAAEGIESLAAQLAAVVNARGAQLAASDLSPLLTDTALHDGLGRDRFAALLATQYRGRQVACRLEGLQALSGTADGATGTFECRPQGAPGVLSRTRYRFRDIAGQWRIDGNGLPAAIHVVAALTSQQGANPTTPALQLSVAARPPQDQVAAAQFQVPGTAATVLQKSSQPGALELVPIPGAAAVVVALDTFAASRALVWNPGDALPRIDVTLQPVDGPAVTTSVDIEAITSEILQIGGIAGTTPAEARLGQALPLRWTTPATFASADATIEAQVRGRDADAAPCLVQGTVTDLAAGLGSITLPTLCQGSAVREVLLSVWLAGTAGEHGGVFYQFLPPADPTSFVPQFMDLPILRIDTNGAGIWDKENYVDATMQIDPNGSGKPAYSGSFRIRGRGNTTWGMDKKPYRIKMDEKAALLGMPAHKDWVLLANYSDKSLMRTKLAFDLGMRLGMAWTPRSEFVELFLNDGYLGTYQLVEKIEVDEHRVDIDKLKATHTGPEQLPGGYLMEVDVRGPEEAAVDPTVHLFHSSLGIPFVFKEPSEPAPQQESWFTDYIQALEAALPAATPPDASGNYAQYLDVEAFIDWYLVNELFKNADAQFQSSVWLHKPRNGRLAMGPLWDFDLSAGNINYVGADDPTTWGIRCTPGVTPRACNPDWTLRLFNDPAFRQQVRTRWASVRDTAVAQVLADVDTAAQFLRQAQLNNFERWTILDRCVWPNRYNTGSHDGEVDYLRRWLQARIEWMDWRWANEDDPGPPSAAPAAWAGMPLPLCNE